MRAYRMALTITALSSSFALFASARIWATVVYKETGFPAVTLSFTGRELDPLAAALAIAGLASVLGIVSVRGIIKQIFGGLVAIMGLGITYVSFAASRLNNHSDSVSRLVSDKLGRTVDSYFLTVTMWPVLSVVAGLLLVGGGLAIATQRSSSVGMSSRYERAPRDTDMTTWQALDQGIDPTL